MLDIMIMIQIIPLFYRSQALQEFEGGHRADAGRLQRNFVSTNFPDESREATPLSCAGFRTFINSQSIGANYRRQGLAPLAPCATTR
jgi:hypothetical protein